MKYDHVKFAQLLNLPENIDVKFYQEHMCCHACHFLGQDISTNGQNCCCDKYEKETEELIKACSHSMLSIAQEQLFRELQSYQLHSLDDKTAMNLVLSCSSQQLELVLNDVKAGCSDKNVISKLLEFRYETTQIKAN